MSAEENFDMVSRLITNLESRGVSEERMEPRYFALSKKSTKEEVARWLQEEGFLVARDKLKGINGKELYSTPKEELKKILGFAESARLFSRLLKEKELLPASEQTIKESDFQRFMRIRREDVDSRIPVRNPVTSFDVAAPPKATRPMIREVFVEPPESQKYVEKVKVKKSKEKPVENSPSKKTRAKQIEESGKKDKRDKKQRGSLISTDSESSEGEGRRRRHHKHSKEKTRDKEEGRGRRDKHKKSHKARLSESESETASGSEEAPNTPPKRAKRKNRKRREKERPRTQEKDKKKEEQPETAVPSPPVPLPPQHQYIDPLHPQMSPYGPVPQILPRPLSPQYPPPFPDPYTNQLMMQQAQIARAEQDRFAAEMRLRQLKSGFSSPAPGALSFPHPMPHFQNFNF